ncbi:ESPR-type extended signal peptide-containing protein [uncultured Megasphaera sp.]|uniref:ESPR-type extended signal peptide-containing protein n=3 Tax=Megasphaera TaxID=906 RepID=UPI00259A2F27|nr:ESPR-type extended signal peptide-containing protein [uncultured Megasphaera sp.]
MNRIYKVIWSKVKNCYIVVSEIAKSHSKPVSTKLNAGKTVAAVLAVAALCAGMTTSVMAADKYYSVDDYEGRLASMGNADNSGAQGIGSMAAGIGSSVQSQSMFQGAMATVIGSLNTVAVESNEKAFDGVANSIVGVANATQNANATLIFGAGNAVSNSYGDVTLDTGSINPADPVGTARKLGAAVGDSGGQVLVIGGANSVDYARFSAVTGVSNTLNGADGNTSDYNFITGAKNTLTNADSTYVIGSSNTVSDGTSNVVIGDKRKLTSTTGNVVIGSADDETETTVSDATILGHNANATVANGVALGSNSVASVAKGVAGTVPTGTTVSDTTTPTWTSTLGAVSVGVIGSDGTATETRQITGVAAGTQATDAVNVAQLNAVNTVVNANKTSISTLETTVNNNKTHFVHINQGTSGTNYNNDGAKGTNSIAIGKASTAGDNSIIIGQGAISKSGDATKYGNGSGDIAIGMGVQVNNYVNQGGGIAIGQNARSENMNGRQEYYLGLGQTTYSGGGWISIGTPDNPENMVTGIAIGKNSYARSGGTMVGTHNYKGAIGDTTVDTANTINTSNNVLSTTVGANSFNAAALGSIVGTYSIASATDATQNFGATIMGSLNSVESATSDSSYAGVANSIVGLGNVANNTNGTLIFGAGNEVTNSITDISVPMSSSIKSAKDLQTRLKTAIKSSNSGGSTMVMGGGNKADYTQLSSVLGVNNTLTGTSDDISTYNYISGFNNTASNVDNVTVIGRNRTVTGADSSIVIGKADSALETTASDAVAIGRNTNVTGDGGVAIGLNSISSASNGMALGANSQTSIANGVALGANSIANVDKGVIGYDPSGKITDFDSIIGTNKERYETLQSSIVTTNETISSLNSDIATLKEEQSKLDPFWNSARIKAIQATIDAKQAEIDSAQGEIDSYQSEMNNMVSAWQSTGAAVSVGDSATGLSRQITNVAAGTNDTDAVNVAQLKANKVTLTAGDNVTITPTTATDGSTDYKIASTDTYVTAGSLSEDGTLTLTRNDKDPITVNGLATKADVAGSATHYYSVNDRGSTVANYDNTGAKAGMSIAAGPAASAYGSASTVTGAFSRIEGNGDNGMSVGFQGATSDVYGSFNVVGAKDGVVFDGVANSVIGVANKTENANAALIMGAGNKITNSYRPVDLTTAGPLAAAMQKAIATGDNGDMVTALSSMVKDSGGAVLAIGGANTADYAMLSKVVGVGNTLTGTEGNESKLNMIDGFANTGTNISNVTVIGSRNTVADAYSTVVIGDNRNLTKASDSVILGSADSEMTTSVSNATAIGHNANVTVANGVALGSGSVASVDKGAAGYNPSSKELSGTAWTSTSAAVSVGDVANDITRQITGVAAGTNDTDAVNVAQLKANKVTVAAGANVTVDTATANDGSTTYTVNSTDTDTQVTGGSATYGTDGKGTITLNTDANGTKGTVTVTGLTDLYVDDVTFADNTLTIKRNDEKTWAIGNLATKDDVSGSATHYYSVNDRGNTVANYDNTGAKAGMSIAAGPAASAYGTASTVTGAFSRIEGNGDNGMSVGFQGATSDVYGSFNVVGAKDGVVFDGVANSVIGVANKTENANAALIMGAGNKITNSYRPVDLTTAGPLAAAMQKAIATGDNGDMVTALSSMVKDSGGAVLAIGGANTADYAMLSKVVGVGNTLTGTEGNESKLNMIDGFANTGTNISNVTVIGSRNTVEDAYSTVVIGDNRNLTKASDSVILGSADQAMTTSVSNATAIGHNANVTVANGVALGSGSVASVDAGVAGYDVETEKASTNTTATWKSTLAAVSVGVPTDGGAATATRQITGVAAGMQDTDAVNVAQLKKVAEAANEAGNTTLKFTGDDTTAEISRTNNQVLNIIGGATATDADGNSLLTDNNIGVVKDGDNALKVKLAKDLTGLNSVAVGDAVKLGTTGLTITNGPSVTTAGIDAGSKVITNVANGVNPTDAVNVSQLTANKVTVAEGTNVTVTPTTANDGSTTYTVAAKDTYTTAGTYDKDGKKITFTQNDTDKNYEVDVSGLVDGISEDIDKGLNFAGDSGDAINKKLDQTLDIVGGAKGDLTTGNIGVVSEDGKLNVRLAKDLTGLNSVAVGDAVKLGTTGLTITNGPSVTTAGIDAGSKVITNVANGVNPTDAVNVSQLTANKVTVAEGTNVTVTPTTANDGSTTYTVAAKDTYTTAGTYDKDGKKITFTQNDTDKNYEVDVSGLVDGISEDIDKGLNFAGDSGDAINKKLDQTLDIVGGAKGDLTTGNIGVISEDGKLNVRLAKDVQDLNSVRIGGTTTDGKGIYIANQTVTYTKDGAAGESEKGNYITGLTNKSWDPTNKGYVSGRAATEDQLKSVYDTIDQNIKANKVTSGKNITVDKDNKVNLNDEITLGDAASNNVAISGTNGTITAGDGGSNQVAIDGTKSTITAGTGDNKVTVDGNNGLVTVGDTTKGAISIGNQTVTPKVVGADGTETDGTAKSGQYITGLDNTTWNPTGEGYVADRAATEGQLKDIADQISNIDTAVKSSSRVFESDSTEQVTRKNTDPMKLKGGATGELSDGNIGVVNNSDKTGFDIKLAKDIKGLNSIEVNNKITIGTGDNQTIIEGDTINTGSVTTGNTTVNNDGLTIVNEDSSKNITINNNNVNMGGNVIKNIGEGSEPTDAINKGQFDRAINNLGTGMNQINNRVNKLDNRVNRVGAGAAALAALHPLEFSPDAKWEVTAGVGNYRGANAIALGAFYRPNFDTMFSIGTSYGGGENMINAGVTWRIGEGETKAYPSKTVMAQEIDDLKTVVSEQQDQIEELKKLVNSLINK